jgi:hypothetical protein
MVEYEFLIRKERRPFVKIRWGPKGRPRAMSAGLSVLLAWSILIAAEGCCEKCPPGDVEHEVFIKMAGDRCPIVGKDEGTRIFVQRGDIIVWRNETKGDVILSFPTEGRLFGVLQAIAYVEGEPLRLRVLKDATFKEFSFDADCGITVPPPVIIVTPPN